MADTGTGSLLPCPFCGGEKHVVIPPNCTKDTPYNPADLAVPLVRCMTCYGEVPGKTWDASGKTAIAAWNRRTAPSEPVAIKPLERDDEGFGELLEELRDASKSPHVAQPLADLFGEAFDALMDLNRLVDDLAAAEKKRSARCSAVDTTTLQWREYPNEYYPDVFGHCWDAETPFGRYEIAEASGSDSPYYNVCFGTSFVADKDGLPDAKAAAQADYEARIRSALALPA